MHLERISAPLFVEKSRDFNELKGTERLSPFDMLGLPGETLRWCISGEMETYGLKEIRF